LGEVLGLHRFQRLPVRRVVPGTLGCKRGKTVVGVKRVYHRFDPLGHGHLGTLEELHRQVGVADQATGNVGRHNGPHALWVAHRAPKGDRRAKGVTAQIGRLDTEDVHQSDDVLAHHLPGLDHQGTVGLAAEATIVRDDAVRLRQRGDDRLVACEHPLQAPWR
jgi:hypothetical protein